MFRCLRQVLDNILIDFGIPVKQVRLRKACLNETCSRVRIGECLLLGGLREEDALISFWFSLAIYLLKNCLEVGGCGEK